MSFDDSNARTHWNWNPTYNNLEKLVDKMFLELNKQKVNKIGQQLCN